MLITFTCILNIAVHGETDDAYPSLSDFHDYEPNLEFDDTELQHPAGVDPGKNTPFFRKYFIHYSLD